ncbi:hypothetical protein HK096_001876, partial [Nowakowskiella sp. JEL0078]
HLDKEVFEYLIFLNAGLPHPDPFVTSTATKEIASHNPEALNMPQGWLKNFTIVRPAFMNVIEITVVYVVEDLQKCQNVSRADVGHFIAKDLIGKGRLDWNGGAVGIAN